MKELSSIFFKRFNLAEKVAFLLSIVCFILTFSTSYYADLRSLTIWSINIWETLLVEKNIFLFYSYTAENILNLPHTYMGCDLLVCIPWAIWNFPLWLIQHFTNISILQTPFLLIYSKLFLLLLTGGCFKKIIQIGKLFIDDIKHIYMCAFLFLSSFFILNSVGYYGQNDILIIYITLLAIHSLLVGKWKVFLLFSAISISFEPYFIFAYIALILFKEKKIHYICLYLISGISIYILQKIPFWSAPMYQESMAAGPTSEIINMFFENIISITPYSISLFITSIIFLYLLIYFDDTFDIQKEKILYYTFISFSCFFIFVRHESYRPLYLFVFLYLIMIIKPKYLRINLLMETLATFTLMIFYLFHADNFFNSNWMIIPFSRNDNIILKTIVQNYISAPAPHLFSSCFFICMITLLVINHPKFKYKNNTLTMEPERFLIPLRSLLITIPYFIVLVMSYL